MRVRGSLGGTVSPRVIRGVAWNGTSRLATRAIQFAVTLILARLLVPADFGLAGMASIVTMLGGMISEMGFGVAIVQKKRLSDDDTSTAFWTSVVLGIAITIVVVATAPLAAAAFRSARVTPIVIWSSPGLLIGALAVTPQAMLVRKLEFRSVAMADVASSITYALVAVVMAATGYGVWSLVISGLVLGVVRTVVLVRQSGIRPSRRISKDSLRDILPFGLKMFISNMVQYLRSNLDYFVVGATLGPTSLGLYTLAFKLADFPRLRLASTITEVALPRISAIQDEDDEVAFTYARSLTGVTLITFPLLIGLASLAPEFIRLAYGPRWEAAITPLQILLMMGIFQSIGDVATTTIVAKGHPGKHLALSLAYLIAVAVFATIGVRWGITGVALAVSASTAIYVVGVQAVLRRVLGISVQVTFGSMAIPAGASALMALALFVCREAATRFQLEPEVWLPVAVVTGVLVFAGAVLGAIGPARARRAYVTFRESGSDADGSSVDVVRAV